MFLPSCQQESQGAGHTHSTMTARTWIRVYYGWHSNLSNGFYAEQWSDGPWRRPSGNVHPLHCPHLLPPHSDLWDVLPIIFCPASPFQIWQAERMRAESGILPTSVQELWCGKLWQACFYRKLSDSVGSKKCVTKVPTCRVRFIVDEGGKHTESFRQMGSK